MADLIIIGGAPGSGKSTIGEILREKHNFPLIDFGWLRQGHLDNRWSNSNEQEEQMALESLEFIINNYFRHGYKNIVVADLQDHRIKELADRFRDRDVKIFSLILADENKLKRRVSGERDSGFKNTDEAIEWNRALIDRDALPNEIKIDNTDADPQKTVQRIVELLT